MTRSEKVYIFGDSVLKGVVLEANESRYRVATATLLNKLATVSGKVLENRSIFGCTISKAKQVINRTLNRAHDIGVAVLEFGGNDCNFDWEAVERAPHALHMPTTSPEVFLSTYESIVRHLQAKSIKVVIMNLPPVDSAQYFEYLVKEKGLSRAALLQFLGDIGRIARFQELYSRLAEEVARRTGALLVDIRSRFLSVSDYSEYMCRDGLHPSRLGHQLIYDACYDFLQNTGPIQTTH